MKAVLETLHGRLDFIAAVFQLLYNCLLIVRERMVFTGRYFRKVVQKNFSLFYQGLWVERRASGNGHREQNTGNCGMHPRFQESKPYERSHDRVRNRMADTHDIECKEDRQSNGAEAQSRIR